MEDEIEVLKSKVKQARTYARFVFKQRGNVARILTGGFGEGYEVVFPDVDTMHVYSLMMGGRFGDPVTYRLSFGVPLKWVGVSHPWGVKPSDIVCDDTSQQIITADVARCEN